MLRVRFSFADTRPAFRFLDSVNAAIVAGLEQAGATSVDMVGVAARSWTFAVKGFSRRGGETVMTGLTISTADETLAPFLDRLNPCHMRIISSNGDKLNFANARKRVEHRAPSPGADEVALAFASPFALIKQKIGRAKTEFARCLSDVHVSDALRAGLSRRAGREIDLEFFIDPITRITDGRPRFVSTRRSGERRILIPAFSTPMTVRGSPRDVRYAYYAGLGAKTRGGFGCPILTN
jgi:CRISPR-associated endoribonuclease Cas6